MVLGHWDKIFIQIGIRLSYEKISLLFSLFLMFDYKINLYVTGRKRSKVSTKKRPWCQINKWIYVQFKQFGLYIKR